MGDYNGRMPSPPVADALPQTEQELMAKLQPVFDNAKSSLDTSRYGGAEAFGNLQDQFKDRIHTAVKVMNDPNIPQAQMDSVQQLTNTWVDYQLESTGNSQSLRTGGKPDYGKETELVKNMTNLTAGLSVYEHEQNLSTSGKPYNRDLAQASGSFTNAVIIAQRHNDAVLGAKSESTYLPLEPDRYLREAISTQERGASGGPSQSAPAGNVKPKSAEDCALFGRIGVKMPGCSP
jgi:hypothetical protein